MTAPDARLASARVRAPPSVTPSGTTTITRDPLDRVVARTTGSTSIRFRYNGFNDTPALELTGTAVTEAYTPLPGGTIRTTKVANTAATDILALPNLHGDIIVTTNGNGTRQGPATNYTAYGQATTAPETTTGNTDAGWLGQYGKLTDHTGGTAPAIDMGARPYRADLGRFLTRDPVEGGCANKHVYVFGDPVNKTDLSGLRSAACDSATHSFQGNTIALGITVGFVLVGAILLAPETGGLSLAGAVAASSAGFGLGYATFSTIGASDQMELACGPASKRHPYHQAP
jgi:RHS repeat-associated protein